MRKAAGLSIEFRCETHQRPTIEFLRGIHQRPTVEFPRETRPGPTMECPYGARPPARHHNPDPATNPDFALSCVDPGEILDPRAEAP